MILLYLLCRSLYNRYSDWGGYYFSSAEKYYPKSVSELVTIVKSHDRVSVQGEQYSHGGQTLVSSNGRLCCSVSLKHLNGIRVHSNRMTYTVQAGATWKMVRDRLRRYGKAIDVCQSYHDFSIGGSISVCCHGRTGESLYRTIKSLEILLANGDIVIASPKSNIDLFNAVIGGYGLCGVIISAELSCRDDIMVRLIMSDDWLSELDKPAILWNTNVYIDFDRPFEETKFLSFRHVEVSPVVEYTSNNSRHPYLDRLGYNLISLSGAPSTNYFKVKQDRQCPTYLKLSDALTEDLDSIKPLTSSRIFHPILQEYFIPRQYIIHFLRAIHGCKQLGPLLLNISIRKVKAVVGPLLSPYTKDRLAVVLCLNAPWISDKLRGITEYLLEHTKRLDGSFYLPYYNLYNVEYLSMYRVPEFIDFKRQIDPTEKFNTRFYEHLTFRQRL